MKPHPRLRKTIKWGGASLTVLLALVWVWIPCGLDRVRLPFGVHLRAGGDWVNVYGSPHVSEPRASFAASWGEHPETGWETPELWRFYLYGDGSHHWGVLAPMWMVIASLLVATTAAWYLDALAGRRQLANLCRKCNYDRTGLPIGAACPECGHGSAT